MKRYVLIMLNWFFLWNNMCMFIMLDWFSCETVCVHRVKLIFLVKQYVHVHHVRLIFPQWNSVWFEHWAWSMCLSAPDTLRIAGSFYIQLATPFQFSINCRPPPPSPCRLKKRKNLVYFCWGIITREVWALLLADGHANLNFSKLMGMLI